jgi:hypothetical protein
MLSRYFDDFGSKPASQFDREPLLRRNEGEAICDDDPSSSICTLIISGKRYRVERCIQGLCEFSTDGGAGVAI